MKPYGRYLTQLDALLHEIEWGDKLELNRQKVIHCLNGGASEALGKIVPAQRIWRGGCFFTGDSLSRELLCSLATRRDLLAKPVYDPTCGVGDLLLRWAEFLPVELSLQGTLKRWESLLFGTDVHAEFVGVAKRRLILQALFRGARLGKANPPDLEGSFPGLAVANVLKFGPRVPPDSTLLMNPPFTFVEAPDSCEWSGGRVSAAAVNFLDCLTKCDSGQRMAAILPDVLRSGSRYARWRNQVESRLSVSRLRVYGRFDLETDVDVFILEGQVVESTGQRIGWTRPCRGKKVRSLCSIHVGAVVPHRHINRGQWRPFISTADLPAWGKIVRASRNRRFDGTTLKPPFVAVRRTSSPGDTERAIGTIVSGKEKVALENHLIALKPRDGTVATCRVILRSLRDRRTLRRLNERIRCRHLTVDALGNLPIWRNGD